jgi:YcxB-like protein
MSSVTINPYSSPQADCDPALIPADIAVGTEGWTIGYELNPDDMAAFSMFAAANSQAAKASGRALYVAGLIAVLVPIVWITILFKMVSWQASWQGWPGLALGGALYLSLMVSVVGFLTAAKRHRENADRHPANANAIGARWMRLAPDGICIWTTNLQSMARWQGITRVERPDHALYFFLTDFSAFIIPRRAFSDEAMFQQFARVAAEFHAQAKFRRAPSS